MEKRNKNKWKLQEFDYSNILDGEYFSMEVMREGFDRLKTYHESKGNLMVKMPDLITNDSFVPEKEKDPINPDHYDILSFPKIPPLNKNDAFALVDACHPSLSRRRTQFHKTVASMYGRDITSLPPDFTNLAWVDNNLFHKPKVKTSTHKQGQKVKGVTYSLLKTVPNKDYCVVFWSAGGAEVVSSCKIGFKNVMVIETTDRKFLKNFEKHYDWLLNDYASVIHTKKYEGTFDDLSKDEDFFKSDTMSKYLQGTLYAPYTPQAFGIEHLFSNSIVTYLKDNGEVLPVINLPDELKNDKTNTAQHILNFNIASEMKDYMMGTEDFSCRTSDGKMVSFSQHSAYIDSPVTSVPLQKGAMTIPFENLVSGYKGKMEARVRYGTPKKASSISCLEAVKPKYFKDSGVLYVPAMNMEEIPKDYGDVEMGGSIVSMRASWILGTDSEGRKYVVDYNSKRKTFLQRRLSLISLGYPVCPISYYPAWKFNYAYNPNSKVCGVHIIVEGEEDDGDDVLQSFLDFCDEDQEEFLCGPVTIPDIGWTEKGLVHYKGAKIVVSPAALDYTDSIWDHHIKFADDNGYKKYGNVSISKVGEGPRVDLERFSSLIAGMPSWAQAEMTVVFSRCFGIIKARKHKNLVKY